MRPLILFAAVLLATSAHAETAVETMLNNPATAAQSLSIFQKRSQDDQEAVCLEKMKQFTAEGRKHHLTPDYCRCVADNFLLAKEDFILLAQKKPSPGMADKTRAAMDLCNAKFAPK